MQVQKLTENLAEDTKKIIFNPNEVIDFKDSVLLISNLHLDVPQATDIEVNLPKVLGPLAEIVIENEHFRQNLSSSDLEQLLRKNENTFTPVRSIDSKRFYEIMENNSKRYSETVDIQARDPVASNIEDIINSLCHPKVICEVCSNYVELIKKRMS